MKTLLRLLTKKSKINPWIGIFFAFTIIIPCLFLMLNDFGDYNTLQFILIFGLLILIKFTKNLIDKIINMDDEDNLYNN
jgi:hypothetical protein